MGAPRVFHHGVTDSTNERAFAALAAGEAEHGDVHVASEQTAGRGSRGRGWESPAGEGLYASLIWMPAEAGGAPASPVPLTMAAALGVRDALVALGAADARLKWPNDVLLGDAKVAGILIETRGPAAARPAFVCGLGVNVAQRSFPAGLRRPATSLALRGVAIAPDALLERLLPRLRARLARTGDDAPALAADFAAAAGLDGEAVVVRGAERTRGRIVGFGPDGLALATGGGTRRFPLEHVTGVEPVRTGSR